MIYCNELPFGVLSPYHYLNIDIVHVTSSHAGEDKSLFDMNRDEYIAHLTVDMIDNIQKEMDIEKINSDDNALFDFFFSLIDYRKEVSLILQYLSPLITTFNHYLLIDTKSMFMLFLPTHICILKNVKPNRIRHP